MLKKHEQLRIHDLLKAGLSVTEIRQRTGFSIGTIYKYKRSGQTLRGRTETIYEPPAVLKPFTDILDLSLKSGKLKINTLMFQLQQAGYTGSQSDVEQYCSKRKQPHSRKRLQHIETAMGEQAQVDWAHFGETMISGRREKVYLFAYILGWSRAVYLEFVVRQNQKTLQMCHIHAFDKVGLPKIIVYDNMKTVVDRRIKLPDGNEKIVYNQSFSDFARYYQFELFASPPYWPRTKGKVESTIKYVRRYFPRLSVTQATTLEDLNHRLHTWVNTQAHSRIHGSTRQKPADMWLIEKTHLRFPNIPPYINMPLQTYHTSQDGLLVRQGITYNLGPVYARRKLEVREVQQHGLAILEIYRHGKVIATATVPSRKASWVSVETLDEESAQSQRRLPELPRSRRTRRVFDIDVEQRNVNHYSI